MKTLILAFIHAERKLERKREHLLLLFLVENLENIFFPWISFGLAVLRFVVVLVGGVSVRRNVDIMLTLIIVKIINDKK